MFTGALLLTIREDELADRPVVESASSRSIGEAKGVPLAAIGTPSRTTISEIVLPMIRRATADVLGI